MSHVDGVDDGIGYGVYGKSNTGVGVVGESKGDGFAVYGYNDDINGKGVVGKSLHGTGVYGSGGYNDGVFGNSSSGNGVHGQSDGGPGVFGNSHSSNGVYGISDTGYGVVGSSTNLSGVVGNSLESTGVEGDSLNGVGVYGFSLNGRGLVGQSDNGYAAYLDGRVYIRGSLQKPGGSFKIDHPLDPSNKYLCHSFVESPDMKNVYDGVVTLDKRGEAEIDLPDWFAVLNKDYRYQLTSIGSPGPNLFVEKEISESITDHIDTVNSNNCHRNQSSFKIAGGTSGMKVSWQVTGIRKDPWANAHRVQVEEDKPDKERGYYLYPELYSQPIDMGISRLHFPKTMKVPFMTTNK
jgi:hypothetical protein